MASPLARLLDTHIFCNDSTHSISVAVNADLKSILTMAQHLSMARRQRRRLSSNEKPELVEEGQLY